MAKLASLGDQIVIGGSLDLDDLEEDEEYSERASRFLQGIGKDDETVENLYSYFRDAEYNLASGTKRAFQDLPNLTDEQKQDYRYLKRKFDNADTGSAKQWLRATADIGFDIATDPTMLLSLLLTPATAGGSLATRAALAQTARVGLKRVGKSFVENVPSTTAMKNMRILDAAGNRSGLTRGKAIRDYYGGEARRLGYLGAAEGTIWGGAAEYLAQERDTIDGINLRHDKSLSEVMLVAGVSGLAGGAIGRYGTKLGQKFDRKTQESLMKFSDETLLDRTDPAFKRQQRFQTLIANSVGRPTTALLALSEKSPTLQRFLQSIRYDALKFNELWAKGTGFDDDYLEKYIKGEVNSGPLDYKKAHDNVHGKLKLALDDALDITTRGRRKLSDSEDRLLAYMSRDKKVENLLYSGDDTKAFAEIKSMYPEANNSLIKTLRHVKTYVLEGTLTEGKAHNVFRKPLSRGPNAYFMRRWNREAVEKDRNELIDIIVDEDVLAPDMEIVAKYLDKDDALEYIGITENLALLDEVVNSVGIMPISELSIKVDKIYTDLVGIVKLKRVEKMGLDKFKLADDAIPETAYESILKLQMGFNDRSNALLRKVPRNEAIRKSQRDAAEKVVDDMLQIENIHRDADLIEGTSVTTSHFSPRTLYKLNDKSIDKFISHDFTSLLEDYIGAQSRLFAREKVFGSNIERFTTKFLNPIKEELAAKGGSLTKGEKQTILDLYEITTGLQDVSFDSALGQGVSDLVKVSQAVAHLPLATMSSLTEILIPLTRVGITTYARGLKEAGKNIGYHLGNQLKRFTGDTITNTRKILQNEHGLTAKESDREMSRVFLGIEQALAQRVEALTGEGVQSSTARRLMNKFFKATLLSQWTRTVQLASFTMGKDLITRNLKTIASLQAVGGTLTASQIKKRSSAAQELFDLGVNVREGLEWVSKGAKKYKSVDTVKNADTGLMQWDEFYEKNVMPGASRFASEVILDPSRASAIRPHVQTGKYGSIIFQFLGYPTAFTNTVLQNWLLQAKRKPVESTARIASTALLMTGAATALNALRTDGKSLEKEPNEVLLDSVSRWGGLGMMEYAFRAEKNREVGGGILGSSLKAISGPTAGDFLDTLLYRKGATEVAATNLPFYSAFDLGSRVGLLPEDFRGTIKKKAKEVDRSFSEAAGWSQPRSSLSVVNQYSKAARQYREPALEYGRVQYIKGGSVDEEVERTGKNPSSRVDRMTGVPYEEQAGAILDNQERETFATGSVVRKTIQEIMKRMTSKEYARDPLRKDMEYIVNRFEPEYGSAYSGSKEISDADPTIRDDWIAAAYIEDSIEKGYFHVIEDVKSGNIIVAPYMAKHIEATDLGLNINLLPGNVRLRNPVHWDKDMPENPRDLMNDEDFVRLVREPVYTKESIEAAKESAMKARAEAAELEAKKVTGVKPSEKVEGEFRAEAAKDPEWQQRYEQYLSQRGIYEPAEAAPSPFAALQKHIDEQEEFLKSLNFKGSKFNLDNVREVLDRDYEKKFNKVLQGLGYDTIRYKNTKLIDTKRSEEFMTKHLDPEAKILYIMTRNLTADGKAKLDKGFLDAQEAGSIPEFMDTLKENIALADSDTASIHVVDLDDVLEEVDIGLDGLPVVTLPRFEIVNDPTLVESGRYGIKEVNGNPVGEILLNEDIISREYTARGNEDLGTGLSFDAMFPDLDSYREFVLKREMSRSQFLKKAEEVDLEYEHRINNIALNAKIDPQKKFFNAPVSDIKLREDAKLHPAQQTSELYRAGLTEEDTVGYLLFDESQFLPQGRSKVATEEEIKIINDTDLEDRVVFITSNEVRAYDPLGASQLLAPLESIGSKLNLVTTATTEGGTGKIISYRLVDSGLLDDLATRTNSPIDAVGDEAGPYTTLLKDFTNSLATRKSKTIRKEKKYIPKGQEGEFNRIMPEARFLRLEIDGEGGIKIDSQEFPEWKVIANARKQVWTKQDGTKSYVYHPIDNNIESRESEVWRHLNSEERELKKALEDYELRTSNDMDAEFNLRDKYKARFSGENLKEIAGQSYKGQFGEKAIHDAPKETAITRDVRAQTPENIDEFITEKDILTPPVAGTKAERQKELAEEWAKEHDVSADNLFISEEGLMKNPFLKEASSKDKKEDIDWFSRFMGDEYVGSGYYSKFYRDLKNTWRKSNTEIKDIYEQIRKQHLTNVSEEFPNIGRVELNEDGKTVSIANKPLLERLEPTHEKVIVGNHGVYLEMSIPKNKGKFIKERRQYKEYRRKNGVKLYHQTKPVNYADYKVDKWYVDIRDVLKGTEAGYQHKLDIPVPIAKRHIPKSLLDK